MSNITEQTKIPLFVVIGASAVILPTLVVVTMWVANLRYDTTKALETNTEQDQIITQINDKLSVVYGFDARLKSIESVLKIKQEVSIDKNKHSLEL